MAGPDYPLPLGAGPRQGCRSPPPERTGPGVPRGWALAGASKLPRDLLELAYSLEIHTPGFGRGVVIVAEDASDLGQEPATRRLG